MYKFLQQAKSKQDHRPIFRKSIAMRVPPNNSLQGDAPRAARA